MNLANRFFQEFLQYIIEFFLACVNSKYYFLSTHYIYSTTLIMAKGQQNAAGKYQKSYKPPKVMSKFIATKTTKTDLVNPWGGTQVATDLHVIADAGTGTGFLLKCSDLVNYPIPNTAALSDYMTITQALFVKRNGTSNPTLSADGLMLAQGTQAQNCLWWKSEVMAMVGTGHIRFDNDFIVKIGTSRKLQPGDTLVLLTLYKTSTNIAGYNPVAFNNTSIQFFEST